MASHIAYEALRLLARQDPTTSLPEGNDPGTESTCDTGNGYDGRLGVRISSIFVILVGSLFGAAFPTFAKRHQGLGVPEWSFFVAKFFGSGVIIATAFIHLLAPANEALGNTCLPEIYQAYPWPEGIALIMVMVMFFVEILTMRYAKFGSGADHGHGHETAVTGDSTEVGKFTDTPENGNGQRGSIAPGVDHLGHAREHKDNANLEANWQSQGLIPETYAAQLTAIFILEFGVIFHSVFIGLTLAVAGEEFTTLYIVLVFHQTFEGLGLGSRLAMVPWPKSKQWTPYFLAIGYGLSTPIAIAIGLGVRNTYPPESTTTLITNGVFDSISAGILIYTGLVELMAHEFMFSPEMMKAPAVKLFGAMGLMFLGAGLMALLGYWA